MRDKTYDIKRFDYDGKKYNRRKTKKLIIRLEEELQVIEKNIEENDKKIYSAFYSLAKNKNKEKEFKEIYQSFLEAEIVYEKNIKKVDEFVDKTEFIKHTTSVNFIEKYMAELYMEEKKFKKEIQDILDNKELYNSFLLEEMEQTWKEYLSKSQHCYFSKEELKYYDDELDILFSAINAYYDFQFQVFFIKKKKLLDFQMTLIK